MFVCLLRCDEISLLSNSVFVDVVLMHFECSKYSDYVSVVLESCFMCFNADDGDF